VARPEKRKRVINLDRLRSTEKVRYERANLTVERMVSVHLTPVEEALRAHRDGRASAEDVAWAFIKEQVTSHTPSFEWETADLGRLLPRITAVANEPKLKAKHPDQLIPELEAHATKERERMKKLSEQMRKSILGTMPKLGPTMPKLGPTMPKLGPTIPEDLLQIGRQFSQISTSAGALRNLTQTNQQLADVFRTNATLEAFAKSARPDLRLLESLRLDLDQFSKALIPQVPDLGINFQSIDQIVGFGPGSDWQKMMERLAEAAREADASEVADAVEATSEESAVEPFEIDLAPLLDRVKELLDQLKNLAPEDSFSRALIVSVAADLIIRFVEHLLGGG